VSAKPAQHQGTVVTPHQASLSQVFGKAHIEQGNVHFLPFYFFEKLSAETLAPDEVQAHRSPAFAKARNTPCSAGL